MAPDPAAERAARPAPDDLDSEMVRYYAARADEYDYWYLRRGRYSHGSQADEAWGADLNAAAQWLAALPFRGQIVELAAGTGWWSPSLARRGQLTLVDATAETLEVARARLAALSLPAEFQVRDVWAEPDRSADGLFAGFWVSHVDRTRLVDFFKLASRWLAPGGLFAFIDSRRDPESRAADHCPPEDEVQIRRLEDGSTFRVRKVFYEPAELEGALEHAGFVDIDVRTTDRFFVLGAARRP